MFEHFALRHIPALIAATGNTISSPLAWSTSTIAGGMHEYGYSWTTARNQATWPVVRTLNARNSCIGVLMWYYYLRQDYAVLDTFLMVLGAYLGVVDTVVVWQEGRKGKAVFRLVASWALAVWGYLGKTSV